ncbi:hypothetical protein [Thermus caldifontis]|uniref:hypothetical protein n=1 Tax=Thermus caldifontis TaxID=1930763 RepID=UPI000DF390E6|nr:hypothetical protein [Thermus caldifontis]
MRRWLPLLVLLLGVGLAQGLPQVREVDEDTFYWFVVNQVREAFVVGLPPERIGEALKGKRVTLVLGSERPSAWAREAKVVRLGGSPFSGGFILADGRWFLGRKVEKGKAVWVIVDSPQVVAVLRGYFSLAVR